MSDTLPHKTVPVQVWADVDVEIVGMVKHLNTIPEVRTEASCQGTIGEGGSNPYRAQVLVTWPDAETLQVIKKFYDEELRAALQQPAEGKP